MAGIDDETMQVLLDVKDKMFEAQRILDKSQNPRAFMVRKRVATVVKDIDDHLSDA